MLEEKEKKILKMLLEENQEGLERLAQEEPAKERRNRLKRVKRRILDLFREEEKVGHITA